MTKVTTKPDSLQPATELAVDLFDNWIWSPDSRFAELEAQIPESLRPFPRIFLF